MIPYAKLKALPQKKKHFLKNLPNIYIEHILKLYSDCKMMFLKFLIVKNEYFN